MTQRRWKCPSCSTEGWSRDGAIPDHDRINGKPCNALKLTRAFQASDDAWGAELRRLFGKRAGDIRYVDKGKGEPGTALRALHDAREAARIAWEGARS